MTDNFPFKQALATDELDLERTISYREDSSNSDKFLHCNTTNTKIFDLEGTPPNLFISGNGDLDTVVNTITQNLARNLVRNPPSPWMKKGVGAQANVRGAILFLRQALENNIFFEHRYNLFLRSVKTVCFGNRDWIICFGDSQNNVAHSSSKTIVAHEIFHSFIHHINRPRGFEAKALVESYCDIFAILFKNKDKNKNEDWEWKIGDEITGFDARDLSLNSNSNGILDISSYQNVKGQTTNNSLIHSRALYKILTLENNNNKPILNAKIGTSLIVTALSKEALVEQFSFDRSYLALYSAAAELFAEEDEELRNSVLTAIDREFKAIKVIEP